MEPITNEEMRKFLTLQSFSTQFSAVEVDGEERWVDKCGVSRTFEEAMDIWRESL